MYISEIRLQNWKNFKSTEASFARRVFLIGPNASGKSNLLDALRFLRDVAGSGLNQAVNERGGVGAIRCLAARESPSIAIQVVLADDDIGPRWRYRIEFNQDATRNPVIRDERVENLLEERVILNRPDPADREDEVRLTQTALEQIIANREFRDIADFFRSISYQHLVPQVVRDPQGFSGSLVQNDPFGRDLLQRLWNTHS